MKTSTENLENDHVYILRLTEIMQKITMSGDPAPEHIETIIGLIRNYADGLHHAKEEELLFPMLEMKGFSKTQGPVAVMLHEHVEGRNFVKGMIDSLEAYKKGNKEEAKELFRNMNGYAELLQNHIAKENNILFRMADKVLSEGEQNDLLVRFTVIENERETGKKPGDYIAAIEKLAEIYRLN